MTINTYGTLKTAVASYLNRSDLTSNIPDFITLGSRRIWYGGAAPYESEPLRIPAMQAQDTGSISGGYIAFPTRFVEPIRVAATVGGSTWSLNYVSPDGFEGKFDNAVLPDVYTYLNNAIYTAVTTAASYTLDYYKAFAAFSADADTNWIIDNAPDLYLYSALVEAAPFLADDPRINLWFGLYRSSVVSLNRSTKRQGSGLAVRLS
jgi:hypothetical protein